MHLRGDNHGDQIVTRLPRIDVHRLLTAVFHDDAYHDGAQRFQERGQAVVFFSWVGVNMTFTVTWSITCMLGGGRSPDATSGMRSNAWVGPECACSSAGLRKSGGGVSQGLISQHF